MPTSARATIASTPLWVRVDQNRTKLAAFVVLFVVGSAALLDLALVGVPVALWGIIADDQTVYYQRLPLILGFGFAALVLLGGFAAAIQLSNAEDWVRNRFRGRDLDEGEATELISAVHDMSLAAGLAAPPRVIVLDDSAGAVNAFAVGTTRRQPLIGVTQGLLAQFSEEEQRAVVATLVARIVAGDIMFGTALAALMGPLRLIRHSGTASGGVASGLAQGCGDPGCSDPGCARGCGDGCSSLPTDADDAGGCLGIIAFVLFVIVVAAITYAAVVTAAWIVTMWGRALQRTSYEKADAEGMLLLKDPTPMLSALMRAVEVSNAAADGDGSYDGIFYASTSGKPGVDRVERRRVLRLREVLGVEGAVHAG